MDEDDFGTAEVRGFRPDKLWLASANGTASSRANLKFGIWSTDLVLLDEPARFLAGLLRHSEDLDPDMHDLQPDLVEPDYDDAAFAEALTGWGGAGDGPSDAASAE